MAASITTSTTFSDIRINYTVIRQHITTIIWNIDATPPVRGGIGFGNSGLPRTIDHEDNLAVLQQIYASTDGFQDSDGNPITPVLSNFDFSTDIDELEPNGIPNPLIAGYEDRIQNKLNMRGYEAQDLVKAKTTDGREQIEHSVDLVTKDFAPKSETYDYPMRRWLVYEETSTQFWVELLIPKHHAIDSALLNDYPPILAFKAWLADIKQSGPDVGSDVTNSADLSIRNYDIPVSGGTLRVRYGNRGQSRDSDSEYQWIRFRFDRQSTGSSVAIESDDLRNYFQALTISLASANITVPVEIGDYNAVHKFQRHDIDESRSVEYVHNSILYHGKVVRSGRPYILPIGPSWGIGLNYSELAIVNSIHQIPFVTDMNAVHFYGQSSDGIIRIPNPRILVRYPGTDRQIAIHNIDPIYNVKVILWNEDENDTGAIILEPGEHFEFRVTLDQNGRTGRIIDEHIPVRVHEDIVGDVDVGDMDSIGYFAEASDYLYVVPLISTTTDNPFVDPPADAFEKKTATFSDDTILRTSDFNFEQVIEVLQDGDLEIEAEWECEVDGSGILGHYSAPRIYRKRGTTDATREKHIPHNEVSGVGHIEPYIIGLQQKVQKGDRYLIILRRHSSSTLGFGNFRLLTGRRRFTLKRHIQEEWSS